MTKLFLFLKYHLYYKHDYLRLIIFLNFMYFSRYIFGVSYFHQGSQADRIEKGELGGPNA